MRVDIGKMPAWPICCREPVMGEAVVIRTPTGIMEAVSRCKTCLVFQVLRWLPGSEAAAFVWETGDACQQIPRRFQEKGEQRGGRQKKPEPTFFSEGQP